MKGLITFGVFASLSLYLSSCYGTSNGERLDKEGIATMCVDGHAYYWFKEVNGYQGFAAMAIVLTDDGKPVKCKGGQSWE